MLAIVQAAVVEALRNPAAFLEARRQAQDTSATDAERATLQAQLHDAETRLARWNRAYEADVIGLEELSQHRSEIQRATARAQARLAELNALQAQEAELEDTLSEMSEMADSLVDLDEAEQREVYALLLREVRLRRGEPPELVWW